ncbi:MAG: PIN domain-containing protein [Fimbriimonadaceae bacterium]|nr:PIN domain-containing protein [Fimbriimonadaceae bacterium]
MLSCDTNVLFHAFNEDSPDHEKCLEFIRAHERDRKFVLSEWVLIETYNLIRNAAALPSPLSARDAVDFIQAYRENKYWRIDKGTRDVSEEIWRAASGADFPRRAIFDARIAYSLAAFGVKRFATRNVGDFERFGVLEAFDPTLG